MTPPPNAYPYWYQANFSGTLTNGSTTTISVRFEEATIFQLNSIMGRTDLDVVGNFRSYPYLVKLSDSGSGQQLSNDYVPFVSVGGSFDTTEGLLPMPMQFSGKSTLVFDIKNNGGTSLSTIYIVLAGIRWRGTL